MLFVQSLVLMAALLRAAPPPASITIEYGGNVIAIDAAAWAALPRQEVTASDHGTPTTFEGVLLRRVLSMAKVPSGSTLRGEALRLIVRIEARDGYQAVFSLAELDPQFRERAILIADTRDGKRLPPDVGPYQVVVPDEARGSRWVRQVEKIVVFSAAR